MFKIILVLLTLSFSFLYANNILPYQDIRWKIKEKMLPLPSCTSDKILNTLASVIPPSLDKKQKFKIKTKQEWIDWVEDSKKFSENYINKKVLQYEVKIKKEVIKGIAVYMITPLNIAIEKKHRLFIYLHGGAYIFGGGISGLSEAILIANRTQTPIVAIDYRMPPKFPYPIAIDDVINVYRQLIQKYAPDSMALGGSSSGGGLSLSVVQKLKKLHLPLPAGLFLGSPWADLTKSGDSLYVNEGIDRKIVTYDGFIEEAAKLYANGYSLKEPGISPLYGDFSDFPPTMLVTGTRDLFLSLTVRVHRKLKSAGIYADLNVYEGLSHVEYFVVPDSPESIEVYRELKYFLNKYLK